MGVRIEEVVAGYCEGITQAIESQFASRLELASEKRLELVPPNIALNEDSLAVNVTTPFSTL